MPRERKLVWDPGAEEMIWVDVGDDRGRPKVPTVQSRWNKFLGKGSEEPLDKRLPKVELSDMASNEAKIVASAVDWLNGWDELGELLEVALRLNDCDPALIMKMERGRSNFYVQRVMKETLTAMADRHEKIGDYVTVGTTSSMDAVLGAGWGEHRKNGSWR